MTLEIATVPRFEPLHHFCREKTDLSDFQPFFERWTDVEMANCALCLAHMVDKALSTVISQKDEEFVTQGGIKERMTAARLGYRVDQRERIAALEAENAALKTENAALREALCRTTGGSGYSGDSGFSGPSGRRP